MKPSGSASEGAAASAAVARPIARSAAWQAARRAVGRRQREDREHAVAQELEHVAALAAHRLDHRLEVAVQRREQRGLVEALAHRREAAQVGEQDRRLDPAPIAAPDRDRRGPPPRARRRDRCAAGSRSSAASRSARAPRRAADATARAARDAGRRSRLRRRSPGSGPAPSRRRIRAAARGSRCRPRPPSRAAPGGRARGPDRAAGGGSSAGSGSRAGTGCRGRRRSRAPSSARCTRGFRRRRGSRSRPRRWPAGWRSPVRRAIARAARPSASRRRQKPSISASGGALRRALPISQAAISATCSSSLRSATDPVLSTALASVPGAPGMRLARAPRGSRADLGAPSMSDPRTLLDFLGFSESLRMPGRSMRGK